MNPLPRERPRQGRPRRWHENSLLRAGPAGIALVALATLGLSLAAALVTAVVVLFL